MQHRDRNDLFIASLSLWPSEQSALFSVALNLMALGSQTQVGAQNPTLWGVLPPSEQQIVTSRKGREGKRPAQNLLILEWADREMRLHLTTRIAKGCIIYVGCQRNRNDASIHECTRICRAKSEF